MEIIRLLRVVRRGAMKAGIQAGAQLDALIVTAPEPVRALLRKLTARRKVPNGSHTPLARSPATMTALLQPSPRQTGT